jgi:hypothetical protein
MAKVESRKEIQLKVDISWRDLSPGERREKRFKKWLSPPDVKFSSTESAEVYKERVKRFIKVIQLEKPDRIPVMLPTGFFPAYYAGVTLQKVMYDYDELRRAWDKYLQDFDMDTFDSPGVVVPGKVLDIIDYRLFKWPGHGLSSDSTFYQYVEGEYMREDEYDAFIANTSDFLLRTFLPRTVGVLKSFQHLTPITPLISVPLAHLIPMGRTDTQKSLKTLMYAGKEISKWQQAVADCNTKAHEKGVPSLRGSSMSQAPFDMIGDTLRGTKGVMMDMLRQPDKLIKAMKIIVPMLIDAAVDSASYSECPVVFIPLHKGNDTFMSVKQYETFYWPTLKELLVGLINEGLVPMPFAQGSYDTRLEIISDIPKGSVIWWFDRTNMTEAKKILGDTACIAGNLPTSLLCTGTPQAVKEYCLELIKVAGKDGGFILTGVSGMYEGNPDNLRVMMEASKEYSIQ